MTELLTSAQMRAIEQAAIESGEVTGLELMERAGKGVAEAIFEEWPELAKTDHRAVVLCGPGNNGGDGFVVARLLHEWGWEVEVFLYGDADKLPPDAKVNYERWLEMGGVSPISESDTPDKQGKDSKIILGTNLFVDALFGTGLTRPTPLLWPVEWLMHRAFDDGLWWRGEGDEIKIVAVDIPSGLCSDSGEELDCTGEDEAHGGNAAYLTVTFHRPKIGHYLLRGPKFCTKTVTVDIGLNTAEFEGLVSIHPMRKGVFLTRPMIEALQRLWRLDHNHKYHHGHALILSGPSTKTGAARLAARGALRIGAGLVTVGAPKDALAEHAVQLNAVMLTEVNGVKNFDDMVLADERINAICVGPALGLANNRGKLLEVVLKSERAVVVDADALTLISQDNSLFDLLHDKCVLTPHAGEFARVFPDIAEKLNATPTKGPAYSKVDATREAAKRAGCVVLFKGPDTVIAAPDGRCAINSAHYERSAPWLATAGSGDVLAGFIAGLLARGFAPMQAAETAAWLHVECALKFGPGLIAEDIPEQLPKVFRDLGL